MVFSTQALEFLRARTTHRLYDLITPQMETWRDITLDHRAEAIRIDGVGFSAIGRLQLLLLLQERARAVGVVPEFERTIRRVGRAGRRVDLVVGADGLNSLVRRRASRVTSGPTTRTWTTSSPGTGRRSASTR